MRSIWTFSSPGHNVVAGVNGCNTLMKRGSFGTVSKSTGVAPNLKFGRIVVEVPAVLALPQVSVPSVDEYLAKVNVASVVP